jgi:NAD+ synthase
MRVLDINREINRCRGFISDYFIRAGFSKAVLGLSGGIDSSLSAMLCVSALGAENVTGVMMPYKTSHPSSLADATELAETLGIKHQTIDISPMVDGYFDDHDKDASPLRKGNWMARTRMCVLFDLSAKLEALVIGTSNRTELLVGYFTQYGDSACAIEPIGHLYKTEVRSMAKMLQMDPGIISKTPTADLWEGQSDEADLGMDYLTLDEILYELTELDVSIGSGSELSYPVEYYKKVEAMVLRSAFKRAMPPVLE